jgi:hypothetical protein
MQAAMDRINEVRLITARVRRTGAGSAELIELMDAELPADDPLRAHAAELAAHSRRAAGTGRLALRRDGRGPGRAAAD